MAMERGLDVSLRADALDFAQRLRDVIATKGAYRVLQCRGGCASRAHAPTGYYRGRFAVQFPEMLDLAVHLQPDAGRIVEAHGMLAGQVVLMVLLREMPGNIAVQPGR